MVKVIGAGFARTGTTSLMAALNQIGYGPVYHMNTIFAHPDHIAFWQAALDGEPVDWAGFLADYQSTLDWPASFFYEQIMQVYPDAKVLLSVRDPERWYESVWNTIYDAYKRRLSPVPDGAAYGRLMGTLIYDRTFHHKFEDKQYALGVFEQYIQQVKERVPSEKLLVFDVKEGWEPLCRFLGVEAPDTPFPRMNDTEAFRRWVEQPNAGASVDHRG